MQVGYTNHVGDEDGKKSESDAAAATKFNPDIRADFEGYGISFEGSSWPLRSSRGPQWP